MSKFHSTFPIGMFAWALLTLAGTLAWSLFNWSEWPPPVKFTVLLIGLGALFAVTVMWRFRSERW